MYYETIQKYSGKDSESQFWHQSAKRKRTSVKVSVDVRRSTNWSKIHHSKWDEYFHDMLNDTIVMHISGLIDDGAFYRAGNAEYAGPKEQKRGSQDFAKNTGVFWRHRRQREKVNAIRPDNVRAAKWLSWRKRAKAESPHDHLSDRTENDIAGTEATLKNRWKFHCRYYRIGTERHLEKPKKWLVNFIKKTDMIFSTIVNEAGASVYSASLATEEYPWPDVTTRGAMSPAADCRIRWQSW